MHFILAALLSASQPAAPQASPPAAAQEIAFATRLSGVALTKDKLERIAVAVESLAKRGMDPLPDFPSTRDLDLQAGDVSTPAYLAAFRAAGLTATDYVEGAWTVALTCSDWVDQDVKDRYFPMQAKACKAWPGLVKRILAADAPDGDRD